MLLLEIYCIRQLAIGCLDTKRLLVILYYLVIYLLCSHYDGHYGVSWKQHWFFDRISLSRSKEGFRVVSSDASAFDDVQWNIQQAQLYPRLDQLASVHLSISIWTSYAFTQSVWRLSDRIWRNCIRLQKRFGYKLKLWLKYGCIDWAQSFVLFDGFCFFAKID